MGSCSKSRVSPRTECWRSSLLKTWTVAMHGP
jgi:hypothetical protein